MKKYRFILMLIFAVSVFSAQAQTLTQTQQKAQKSMLMFLKSKNITASIDSADQSVTFKKLGVLYWITFSGENPMIFTINRKGYKTSGENSYNKSLAVRACNEVNKKINIKCYCQDTKVVVCMPVIAKNVIEFQNVFDDSMKQFDDADKIFKESYAVFEKESKSKILSLTDSVVGKVGESSEIIVPQNNPSIQNKTSLTVSDISIRGVDSNNNVVTEFDRPIRKSGCKFIQVKLMLSSSKAGTYKIGMRIVTPDGKTLIPEKGARYSTITPVEVAKANKTTEAVLYKFGQESDGLWSAGEYVIEFFEDESKIYSTTFNVL